LVVGVGLAGLVLTAVVDGKAGVRALGVRMARWRVGAGWYAVLLLPPALILAVLGLLGAAVSADFRPSLFLLGALFGLPAGFFEEIGWTGYAFPRMAAGARRGPLAAGAVLGLLWGMWHLPVVDHLGAASPHGAAWLPFFVAFVAVVTAVRVLIAWVYTNTGSLLLAQLLHFSSTGALVVLSPAVSPAAEAAWYGVYAAALWAVVALGAAFAGGRLTVGAPPAAAPGA
jgi:membrane protease YdiL (CAAX protease family)